MPNKTTDSHIKQIKIGNPEAWKFVRDDFEVGLRYQATRLLQNSRIAETVTVDDLVQETWLKAWNGRSSFRGSKVPEFVKWLLVILKNTYFDKCRKGRFELTSPFEIENQIGSEKTPSEIVSLAENDSKLAAMLAKLDMHARRIIKLKHVEGLTFREIAKRLGKNPNSVASIYRRALRALKTRLAESSSSGGFRIS